MPPQSTPLPHGRRLPEAAWLRRHRWCTGCLAVVLLALAAACVLTATGVVVPHSSEVVGVAVVLLVIDAVALGLLWTLTARDPGTEHQVAVDARLRQLEATREDLLATVSHEFRTPLTAIQGAALTMRKHRARLADARVDQMLDAIVANTERLGRLLENMLTAAEARTPDEQAVSDVHQVATEVTALVEAAHPERTPAIVVAVEQGLEARVETSSLHQILANLLSNAIIHAQPGSQAIVSGAADGDEVVVTVANEAQGVDATMLAELFLPFTQRDSSSTRVHEGAGVGLYVVRRLVEVASGSLAVRSQPGWVSIEVRLPRAMPHVVDLNGTGEYADH